MQAVQDLLNNHTAGWNSSKILIESSDISHLVLPGRVASNETRCAMERVLLTSMVQNVLHVSQVNCRRKKKLIKIWHKPKPGVVVKQTQSCCPSLMCHFYRTSSYV